MKFKVQKQFRPINQDIIMNPSNNEIGLLQQYIDVEGNYRENVRATFQINSPTNTHQGWKERYEELFGEHTQTGNQQEPYPIGSSWNDPSGFSFFTIQAIIQVYGEKLYVISDGGHHANIFGVHHSVMPEFTRESGYHAPETSQPSLSPEITDGLTPLTDEERKIASKILGVVEKNFTEVEQVEEYLYQMIDKGTDQE